MIILLVVTFYNTLLLTEVTGSANGVMTATIDYLGTVHTVFGLT